MKKIKNQPDTKGVISCLCLHNHRNKKIAPPAPNMNESIERLTANKVRNIIFLDIRRKKTVDIIRLWESFGHCHQNWTSPTCLTKTNVWRHMHVTKVIQVKGMIQRRIALQVNVFLFNLVHEGDIIVINIAPSHTHKYLSCNKLRMSPIRYHQSCLRRQTGQRKRCIVPGAPRFSLCTIFWTARSNMTHCGGLWYKGQTWEVRVAFRIFYR